jgi:DNA-binding response OmpR family regulator
MKILYAEDEPYLAFVIKDGLEAQGFEVLHLTNGKEAVEQFSAFAPDLVLLDYAMPEMDGIEACRKIRSKNKQTPIIFASAHSHGATITDAYRAGATDYIQKPFGLRELLLHIETIVNKATETETEHTETSVFPVGQYTFDAGKNELHGFGQRVHLNKKERAILRELCLHDENIVERRFLLRKYWDSAGILYSRSLDTYIAKLRKHLETDPSVQIITVKGLGYKLQII